MISSGENVRGLPSKLWWSKFAIKLSLFQQSFVPDDTYWYDVKYICLFWNKDLKGQSCRTGTMHFLKGELEVFALDVFL